MEKPLPKDYYKEINSIYLEEIEDPQIRAIYAREVCMQFFGGVAKFARRSGYHPRTLYNARYNQVPLTFQQAMLVDSWNEGLTFTDLRPDLIETPDNISPRCVGCPYRP